MKFQELVALGGQVMEAVGVAVLIGGSLFAAARVLARVRRAGSWDGAFRHMREDLGRAILLGLEFLVAADIIRTVSEVPTLERVVVLAVIVLIRTFLSFTLEVELEGKWPWQRRGPPAEAPIPKREPVPGDAPPRTAAAPPREEHAPH
jgi:uncharacterized membrane protein